MRAKREAIAIAMAMLTLALGACSGSSEPSATPASTAPLSSPPVTATPTPTPTTSPPAILLCAPSNTKAGQPEVQGAAGTEYFLLRVRNVSSKPCRTGGYPGVQLLRRPGQPMRTTVERSKGRPLEEGHHGNDHAFLVKSGGHFFVQLSWSALGRGCNRHLPPKARALRLTLPDNTASVLIHMRRSEHSQPVYACRGHITAYRVFNRVSH